MTGPIIAGEHPRREAFFIVALVALILVFTTPELASKVLGKFPWLAPVFAWVQQHLNHHRR